MATKVRDDKTRLAKQTAHEVKGQRTARSADTYLTEEGTREAAFCRKCGVIYRNKRWYMDERELATIRSDPHTEKIVCPSCQRMQDNNPGGIVTLSGEYLQQHELDILDLLKNKEAGYRAKNPLARIMEISQEGNVLTIATTDEKLAQKLGRDVYRAHKGNLHYLWSHDEKFVRVRWDR